MIWNKFDSKLFHIFPRISSICTCRNVWLCVFWANFFNIEFLSLTLSKPIYFFDINQRTQNTYFERKVCFWLINLCGSYSMDKFLQITQTLFNFLEKVVFIDMEKSLWRLGNQRKNLGSKQITCVFPNFCSKLFVKSL